MYFIVSGTSDVKADTDAETMAKKEQERVEFAAFEDELEFFKALGETPLAKNAFFIRTMADSVFNGEGTEGITPGRLYILAF